jgi:hypothetical protein
VALIVSAVVDQPLHGGSVQELRQCVRGDLAIQILTDCANDIPDHVGRDRTRQIRQQNPHLAVDGAIPALHNTHRLGLSVHWRTNPSSPGSADPHLTNA